MLSEMTSEELTEWMAYGEIEPFGEVRSDLRMAKICETMVNVNRVSKDSPVAKVSDFMPDFAKHYRDHPDIVASQKAESAVRIVKASSVGKFVTMYEGEAPPIRRLGKKGIPPKKRRVLRDGKPW
jgi:hypothetical protein